MTTEQWERVRDLFERALEEPPVNLSVWLEAEVNDDPEVRAEVASLLHHRSQIGNFMDQAVADRVPELLTGEPPIGAGRVIGQYRITREIGRGGMGCVYLASDQRLGRTVALKALSPDLVSDPSQRARLKREARAAAALAHPGICTVYALEEIDGRLYIATEFVDGHSLRDEIKSGRRPSPQYALETANQLAGALSAAHAAGIVHRDLKPENVMRTRDGGLKILDFGLAQITTPGQEVVATRVTTPGTIVGTPAYMAPEQLNGQQVDSRADVFAFGVMMYEYVTHTHPFCATTPLALAARVLESDVVPLPRLVPHAPPSLVAVIETCLQKLPDHRYTSAVEIEHALARDVTPPNRERTVSWWRTHHIVIIGLYFLGAVVGWTAKEWHQGLPNQIFIALSILATIGGILRGQLLFTERVHPSGLAAVRIRGERMTWLVDVSIGLALIVDGAILLPTMEVAGVLTAALGVGLILARALIEPSTNVAAFSTDDM